MNFLINKPSGELLQHLIHFLPDPIIAQIADTAFMRVLQPLAEIESEIAFLDLVSHHLVGFPEWDPLVH